MNRSSITVAGQALVHGPLDLSVPGVHAVRNARHARDDISHLDAMTCEH
jgi:hypothetical protein